MSWRLVEEVTSATADWPARERLILVLIAQECRGTDRRISPGSGWLASQVGLSRIGLRRALQRLARRGYEIRVPIGRGRDGRPIYAVPGVVQTYRLPVLDPAKPQLRQGGTAVSPGGTPVPPGGTSQSRQAAPQGVARRHRAGAPSPVPEPDTTTTSAPDAGELRPDLAQVVVDTLTAINGPRPGRVPIGREARRLSEAGWTPDQLAQALLDHDWSGARAGAVVMLLRGLNTPPAPRPPRSGRPAVQRCPIHPDQPAGASACPLCAQDNLNAEPGRLRSLRAQHSRKDHP